ncbi:DUF4240 domain-containing protein [Lentzea sp. NPDC051213]|uniref:DUF4240 domain-containing protein n=1 Tax=Lentzea sp. NPDC051213 TaxID=3364126 RepID=UPI0037888C9B
MDLNAFWALVERSAAETSDQDERLEWLAAALAALPPADVVDFAVRLDELRRRVDTWEHWHAGWLIWDGLCSDDGFFYFQAWLVGLGRSVFESVVTSPDALADVPQIQTLASRGMSAWTRDDEPDWECLDYVAVDAFDGDLAEVLASRGLEVLVSPDPAGAHWDFADPVEIVARLPRLGALFGKVA